jgi:chemotaxis response regulator CheB
VHKLMIIDDNASDRGSMVQIAESISCVKWSRGFANPQDAINEMRFYVPDVVIIAVELSDTNGLSVTRRLLELQPWFFSMSSCYSESSI